MTTATDTDPWVASEDWALPAGHIVTRHGIWASVLGPRIARAAAAAGWKLHVSARVETLAETVATLTPLLFAAGCDFKVIASTDLLRELNCGVYGEAAVGKALTVYPDPGHVAPLGRLLAAALAGRSAPRIGGDRIVRADAPVYYRYGPIAARWRTDESGHLDVCLPGPDGSVQSGAAALDDLTPGWAIDPFEVPVTVAEPTPALLAERYRITGGISRSHRGSLYRATDLTTNQAVVVKQAKAWVDESGDGDARAYLRHERRVLARLQGLDDVPLVVDHFGYGEDEYLVTTDLGATDLRSDVVAHGVFAADEHAPRSLPQLARALLARLDAMHARGVVIRDLAPKNVVVRPDGTWGLIDFELSRIDGEQRYGWSAGYSHPDQRRRAPARVEDDYYSLGATLFYALTGMDPICLAEDPALDRARTLAALWATDPDQSAAALVAGLLDADPARRASAAARLRSGAPAEAVLGSALHRPARGAIIRHTLAALVDDVRPWLSHGQAGGPAAAPTPFPGTAGVLAELIHHPAALDTAHALARLTVDLAYAVEMQPGLTFGRMGTALALHGAAAALEDADLAAHAAALVPTAEDVERETRPDVTHGLAGLGIGYLALADRTEDPVHRRLAARCVERLLHEINLDAALAALPPGQPGHGINVADGFAHGRAGVAYLLLAQTARTGDAAAAARARHLVEGLALVVPSLAAQAASPTGRPMAGSWCQGLAGIGMTLVRAAHLFADDRFLETANTAATGALAIARRTPLVTQCCGLAGIGDFLLDVALLTGERAHRRAARDVLALMLTRSAGTATAPRFPDSSLMGHGPEWGTGTAGVLSFLRRLTDPARPRLWLADTPALLGGAA